jgi:hypothetical protein
VPVTIKRPGTAPLPPKPPHTDPLYSILRAMQCRTCTKCQREFPIEEFKATSGYLIERYLCTHCRAQVRASQKKKGPPKTPRADPNDLRECCEYHEVKPLGEGFYRSNTGRGGYRAACRLCVKAAELRGRDAARRAELQDYP